MSIVVAERSVEAQIFIGCTPRCEPDHTFPPLLRIRFLLARAKAKQRLGATYTGDRHALACLPRFPSPFDFLHPAAPHSSRDGTARKRRSAKRGVEHPRAGFDAPRPAHDVSDVGDSTSSGC